MAVFLGAALLALDLIRPYTGPSLRPFQWLAGAAAVAWLWRNLVRRGVSRATVRAVVALAAFLVPVSVDHSRSIEADGVHYYSYLRSLLFDGDLDLRNDYRHLEFNEDHKNVVPVGASLMWAPFVAVVYLFAQAARLLGAAAPTGVEPVFQAVVAQATFVYSAAGLFVLMDALRRLTTQATAFWVTLLLWLGSPLRFYLSVLPSMGHGTEFFAAALVLHAALRLRESPSSLGRATLAGAACGLAFLVRSQDGILLVLPCAMLLPQLLGSATRRQALAPALRIGLAFVVVALPQLAVWQAMYGTPFLIPYKVLHGEEFMHLERPELIGTLISPRGGVFTSYPVLLLGVLGVLALAPRDPRFVLSSLPILLGGWYVNATVFDWYQVRRFTGLVPLLAPGLAVVLRPLARAGALPLAALAFGAWRYDLAVDSLRSQPGQPAPVRAVLERAADDLAGDSYALLEPRLPGAAVVLLSAYTGEALLREPVSRIDLGRETSLLRLPRPARNLSALSAEDGLACRWVQGDVQATFFLPLAWDGEVTVTLTMHPLETTAPMNLDVLLNEKSLGRRPLDAGWKDYRFAAPAGTARLGTNVLVVRLDRAPIYHQVRGTGARQRRPAAIAAITLHRGEPRS